MIQGQTSKSVHSGDSSLAESGRTATSLVVPSPSPILDPMVVQVPMDTTVVPPSSLPSQSFSETHASPTFVDVQTVDGAILGAKSALDEDIRLMNVEPVELVKHNSSSSDTHTSTGCTI